MHGVFARAIAAAVALGAAPRNAPRVSSSFALLARHFRSHLLRALPASAPLELRLVFVSLFVDNLIRIRISSLAICEIKSTNSTRMTFGISRQLPAQNCTHLRVVVVGFATTRAAAA